MARLKPGLQSSKGRSKPWAGARLVNAFAEMSEGDKAEMFSVMAIPGLSLYLDATSLPVRGLHRMGSTLFGVIGTGLYQIAGSATLLGTIPGENPVRMADNGTEIAVHDGGTTGYVYSGGSVSVPANLPAVTDVAYIDGYFVWTLAASDQFIISDLDNGTSYDPLDVATVEGAPDDLVGVINDHRELLFFGLDTIEVWVNTGNADFPFERQGNAFIEHGCADRNSIAKADNSVFFVGHADRVVYRLNGYDPQRISTHAVEKVLAGAAWFRAFTYAQEGHKFYVLNMDVGTWAFDMATGAWAERQSFGLDNYRCGSACAVYNTTILGDNRTGKLYTPDLDVHSENGTAMPVTIELPAIGDGVSRQTLYSLEVYCETGVGDTTVTDPQIAMRYSRDGGRSWSNEISRTLGAQGDYSRRAIWRPNVEFRQLQVRLTLPDKVRRCVLGYDADIR